MHKTQVPTLASPPKLVDVLDEAQERLLRHVLGILGLLHIAPRKAVPARLEAIHQGLEGGKDSLLRPSKQLRLVGSDFHLWGIEWTALCSRGG